MENGNIGTVQNRFASRIHFLDETRGAAIVLMVLFHLFYSMAYIFGLVSGYKLLMIMMPIEPFIAGTFIFCSGFSARLSHSNMQRGVKLLAIALAITVITAVAMPDIVILFGVLHFLALAMIIFALIKPALDKVPLWLGITLCSLLFVLLYKLPQGEIGVLGLCTFFKLPPEMYSVYWLFPFGFPTASFASSDYFPLLPWIFLFLLGSFLSTPPVINRLPKFMYKKQIPPLCFLGRHSLVIYVVHQPVIIGLLWVTDSIFLH